MMKEFIAAKAKHYDRTIVLVVTALSVLSAVYWGTQNSVNRLIDTSEVVHSLKLINAQQAILNLKFTEDLSDLKSGQDEMHKEVTQILFTLKRR